MGVAEDGGLLFLKAFVDFIARIGDFWSWAFGWSFEIGGFRFLAWDVPTITISFASMLSVYFVTAVVGAILIMHIIHLVNPVG